MARGEPWTVDATCPFDDCEAVALSSGSGEARRRRTLLRPFDRIVPVTTPAPRVVGRRAWARHALGCVAGAIPFASIEAAASARIELLPFQLEPAIAALQHGHTRLLIADEVGLGKTIQAALLLSELSRITQEMRAILLTPASLVEQWSRELLERFGLKTTLADAAHLAELTRTLPPDVNPWCLPGIYVVSLDFVKQPEVLGALEQALWDIAIVDEAHNAAIRTHRRAAAHAVASRARRVVLLTATPPEGDRAQLAALLQIGAAGDRVVQFRRTRADVGMVSHRRTTALHVRLSAPERRLHRELARYAALLWRDRARRSGSDAHLLAILLHKRALSSAAALAISIRRRIELLDAAPAPGERQMLLPLDDGSGDDPGDSILGAPGLADPACERTLLARLARLSAAAAQLESIVDALRRFLRRAREPAIVFTEYRDTLLHLEAVLRTQGTAAIVLHGGMTPAERNESARCFNDRGAVLLATDAAAEGLNLHRRCRAVLHFELPWTPARLEQRSGRVDRIGQIARVHELLLVARHSAEGLVLLPLLRRARAAAAGHTHGRLTRLTELMVAAAVITGTAVSDDGCGEESALAPVRFTIEAAGEAKRLSLQRRILQPTRAVQNGGVAVSAIGRGPVAAATLLFDVALVDDSGRRVHAEALAVRVDWAWPVPPMHRGMREFARRISEGAFQIEQLVLERTRLSFDNVRRQHEASEQSVARRGSRIVNTQSAATRLAQASLFDRRDLSAARRLQNSHEVMLADADADRRPPAHLVPQVTLRGVRFEGRRSSERSGRSVDVAKRARQGAGSPADKE